jgi:hypothetical protein
MRKSLIGFSFLCITLLAVPAAFGQNKQAAAKNNANYRTATDDDYVALAQMKEVVGHLLTIDGSKQLTVRVDYPVLELKAGSGQMPRQSGNAQNQIQNQLRRVDQALARQQQALTAVELSFLRMQQTFLRQYLQVLKVKNPVQRQQRYDQLVAQTSLHQMQLMQQMMRAASIGSAPAFNLANINLTARHTPYKVVTATAEFALPILENLKVARTQLEIEYDAKGNVIQYKPDELKKKQDPDMPGYRAKLEDVLPGQLVKLYLGKSKAALAKEKAREDARVKAKQDAKEKAAKAKDQEDAVDKAAPKPVEIVDPEENRPQVRMLLIMSDPDPAYLPKETPQKKAKKKRDFSLNATGS